VILAANELRTLWRGEVRMERRAADAAVRSAGRQPRSSIATLGVPSAMRHNRRSMRALVWRSPPLSTGPGIDAGERAWQAWTAGRQRRGRPSAEDASDLVFQLNFLGLLAGARSAAKGSSRLLWSRYACVLRSCCSNTETRLSSRNNYFCLSRSSALRNLSRA
jgi:hypothetical protein